MTDANKDGDNASQQSQATEKAEKKVTATKKTSKPKAVKSSAATKAPPDRAERPDDCVYSVKLNPRHAGWVEMRAKMSGRTVESMLEKIVREAFNADPNSKTGSSVHAGSDAGAELAAEKTNAAAQA
jgi:hypothetical protein